MKKIRIGVLMGGPSAEREISLVTGKAVCENLDKEKYEVLPIEMSKDGKLLVDKKYFLELNNKKIGQAEVGKELINLESKVMDGEDKIDIVFIAMHGTYGEDGCVQGMLEGLGMPYTGSRVLASALAMNKARSADIYRQHGLTTPNFIEFSTKKWKKESKEIIERIKNEIKLPVVIKPVDQGSSVGTFLVKKEEELVNSITSSFIYTKQVMAQEYIMGKELTCGVLEKDGEIFATPVTEIIANAGEFYDLASKYDEGGSTHICPAELDEQTTKKMQGVALKAHKILGCRGMSRTDVFLTKDGKLHIIETNTIPGMTPTSLLPEGAGKAGIGFDEMLDLIIKASL